MSRGSIINPLLTLEYMQPENDNKHFDRKSGRICPVDLVEIEGAITSTHKN